ncbi:hypothetical protein DZA35_01065 [Arcobacter sp. HD9-500m-PIT-SAG03]|nr:hypothetical protein DZA35_01065 [Arcobacter sp. HD9-500m-PIT-SAG03]
MIKKLYNLKKLQINQRLAEKSQLLSRINEIENEVFETNNQIVMTSVNKHGAISDFAILQLHKDTMKLHITKLEREKKQLESQVEALMEVIIELQKESEQFDYLLKEEKKRKFKEMIKAQDEEAAEYMQSKYIAS